MCTFPLSIVACLAVTAFLTLVSPSTAEAQVKQKDSPVNAVADSLVKEFHLKWSQLKLIPLSDHTVEALLKSFVEIETEADIERLDQIGEIIAPIPLPNFASSAVTVSAFATGQSYNGFKLRLCQRYHYSGYDCDALNSDALQQAFSIASAIHLRRRSIPPSSLFVLASNIDSVLRIHALLELDSDSTGLRLINYARKLDDVMERILLAHLDTLVKSDSLPFTSPTSMEQSTIPRDSLEKWSKESRSSNRVPRIQHVAGFTYLWLRTKGERVKEFGPIVLLRDRIQGNSLWRDEGVDTMGVECNTCNSIGLAPRMVRSGRLGWTLQLGVEDENLFEERLRSFAPIDLELTMIPDESVNTTKFRSWLSITIIPDDIY